MQTLIFISVIHEGGDIRPLFWMLLIKLQELIVLFSGPSFDFSFGDFLIFLFDLHVDVFTIFGGKWDDKLFLHSSIKRIKLNRRLRISTQHL